MGFFSRLRRGRGSTDPVPVPGEPLPKGYYGSGRPPAEKKSRALPSLLPNRTFFAKWREWNTQHAVREGYRASTWVYNAVELRRRAVASVPWHVETRDASGDWQRAPDHPLQQLIDDPNPDFSQRQLISRLVQWLDLGGDAYWTKVRAGKRSAPVELWPLMPDGMKAVPGRERLIDGYRYEYENVTADLSTDDVVHFAYPNPGDFYYGMPPLRAAGMAVDIDTESQRYQKVSLQNRGIPDGVFTLDDDETTRDQWEQARDQVREQYQTKDSFRSPWVVAHAKWQQMSLTPAEMDYIESRRFTREEILSAFNVPPPMVGIYDNATLSNIETARKIFWLEGVVPLLEELCDQLNRALVPEFGHVSGLRIVYDLTNVDALREKFNDKVEAAQKLWGMGVPFNQIAQRLELGIDEIPGGDTGFLPSSVLPTDIASGSGTEPAEVSAGGTEATGDDDAGTGGELDSGQVTAIMELIEQVARGDLPRASAIAIIAGGFPLSTEEAEAMVGEVGDSFFIEDDEQTGERATLPDEVKSRVRAHRKATAAELHDLAYGSGAQS